MLAMGLATLPILIRGSIAGHELIQPLAVVLLGGLVTTALVNLFVLPLLYLRLGPSPAPSPLNLEAEAPAVSGLLPPDNTQPAEVVSMRGVQVAAPRRRWLRGGRNPALGFAIVAASLALAGCGSSDSGAGYEEPAVVEAQGEVAEITLTPLAAERLDVQTGTVQESGGVASIPYAAVLYKLDGSTWAYTNPEELVFVRASITIDRIEGDTAFLRDGPPSGTEVVTVGVAELWGTELGIE